MGLNKGITLGSVHHLGCLLEWGLFRTFTPWILMCQSWSGISFSILSPTAHSILSALVGLFVQVGVEPRLIATGWVERALGLNSTLALLPYDIYPMPGVLSCPACLSGLW